MARTRLRLDALLVARGLFESGARAQAAVMAGLVLVDGKPALKAGQEVSEDAEVGLVSDPNPYVSRGGLKLAAALDGFGVRPESLVCLDVGASTGGFTDCLLQRGAARVYAVDVGHGQLHEKLRRDARVTCLERLHARDLKPSLFTPRPSLAVIDVSFISLTAVLPRVLACLAPGAAIVALVKPQFELGPKLVPKGVVRDPAHRAQAVEKVREAVRSLSLKEAGLLESPVHGPKGNVEFFLHLVS